MDNNYINTNTIEAVAKLRPCVAVGFVTSVMKIIIIENNYHYIEPLPEVQPPSHKSCDKKMNASRWRRSFLRNMVRIRKNIRNDRPTDALCDDDPLSLGRNCPA